MKESELICIDCILSENHKDHKLVALDKAVERENYVLTQNQKEVIDIKENLVLQKEKLSNQIDCYFKQEMDDVVKAFERIRNIIDQKEREIKETLIGLNEKMNKFCKVKINEIEAKLNNVSNYEEIHTLKSFDSQINIIKFLRDCKTREQLFTNSKIPIYCEDNIPTCEININDEIKSICNLILGDLKIDQPKKDEKIKTSNSTIYNKSIPKTKNNVQKTSIPRIHTKRFSSARDILDQSTEKKIKTQNTARGETKKQNASAFGRKNSACNPSGIGNNNNSLLISHQPYNTIKGSKKSFVRPSEKSKSILQINQTEDNIEIYNDLEWKESTLQITDDLIEFNIDCEEPPKPHLNYQERPIQSSMPERVNIKIDSNDIDREFIANKLKTSRNFMAKASSTIKQKEISYTLMEKRNLRKREKQNFDARDNKSVIIQKDEEIEEISPDIQMDSKEICQTSSRNFITHSISHFASMTDRIQRFHDHHSVVSTIVKNSNDSTINKENTSLNIGDKSELDQFFNQQENSKIKNKKETKIVNFKDRIFKKNSICAIPDSL